MTVQEHTCTCEDLVYPFPPAIPLVFYFLSVSHSLLLSPHIVAVMSSAISLSFCYHSCCLIHLLSLLSICS